MTARQEFPNACAPKLPWWIYVPTCPRMWGGSIGHLVLVSFRHHPINYSFQHDMTLSAFDELLLQGYGTGCAGRHGNSNLTNSELKNLAGEVFYGPHSCHGHVQLVVEPVGASGSSRRRRSNEHVRGSQFIREESWIHVASRPHPSAVATRLSR
eukprot:11186152-Lingulodinium_polyedra.AAC.1